LFSYLDNHPEASLLFHALMSDFSEQEVTPILEAYDYSGFLTVVDVGGGNGALITALLRAHPALHGTIVDLDTAAKGARLRLAKAGLERRGRFHPGSFFQDIPVGADLYILKNVLHNWKEPAARRILHNCQRAMRSDSRLLLIERVIAEAEVPSEAKLFDINMLVVTGGEERTEASYRQMLQAADLKLLRVVPTRSPLSLLEATPGSG
jgi:hypothetical protein